MLRNIKGETQYALQKEFGVSSSEIRRWKQVFLESGAAGLRVPAKSKPGPYRATAWCCGRFRTRSGTGDPEFEGLT